MSKKKYADCIVMNTDNEVLLLQRSSNDEFMPSKWCLPGGHVDDGEEFATAAKRELFEEVGLECNLIQIAERDSDYEAQYFYALVKGRPTGVIDNDEHFHVEWVPLDKIDDYEMIPDHKDLLKTAKIPVVQNIQEIKIDQVESPLEFIEKLDGHFEIISKAFDADEIDADVYMSYLRRYKKLRIEKSIEIIKTAFDSDQINEHQYIDAIRKAKTITEPLDDLIAEHKHLVKVLKTGNKKAGKEEAKEQGEELKEFEKDKKGTEE